MSCRIAYMAQNHPNEAVGLGGCRFPCSGVLLGVIGQFWALQRVLVVSSGVSFSGTVGAGGGIF
jgi:hypothetical protein